MPRPKAQSVKTPVTVRFNEKEKSHLNEKANESGYGANISEYIRQSCLNGSSITVVYNDKEIMNCLFKMDSILSKIELSSSSSYLDSMREEMQNICSLLKQ